MDPTVPQFVIKALVIKLPRSDTGPQSSSTENMHATQPDYLVHFCSSLLSPHSKDCESYLILFLSFFLFNSSTQLLFLFTLVALSLLPGFTSMFTICKIELVRSCYYIATHLFEKLSAHRNFCFLASSSKYVFLHHLVLISSFKK